MEWKNYFPYKPRLDQQPIAELVWKNIQDKGVCIIEAPYGIGKSIAMLSSALASGKKVIFATCNNAAHNSIVDEVLRINKRLGKNLTVASLIGKGKLCLQETFTYDFCEQLRKDKACKFYEGTYDAEKAEKTASAKLNQVVEEVERVVKTKPYEILHTPFSKYVNAKALEHGVCPYELMLKLGERADVVILDYFHVFTNLLLFSKSRLKIVPKDCILFVDEADELKDRMLSHLTKQLSMIGLQRFKEQAKKTHGMENTEIKLLDDFIDFFSEIFTNKNGYFDISNTEILAKLETQFGNFDEFLDKLSEIVEKVSKSYERVASHPDSFLELLKNLPEEQFCYGFRDQIKETLSISNYELHNATLMEYDHKPYRMKDVLNEFHASILFSATIGNVEIFKKGVGIEYADFFSSNKFNTDNFKVILKRDISSLYRNRKETAVKVVEDVKFCNEMSDGVLLALPSQSTSYDIVPHINAKNLDLVKECEKGVYYAVLGGKSSRGINKAANLSIVYIYGLQLPPKDDYLFLKRRDYLMKKYPKEIAYKLLYSTVVSKACQTAGRIFRRSDKKGLVVFADSRYKYDFMQGSFFYNCFPAYFKEKMCETYDSKTFQSAVSSFWGKLPF